MAPDPLTPARLLGFATIGGAANAGLADRTGSLTPGKQADIVLIRADSPATVSAGSPAAIVTSLAHPGSVDTVLVAGQIRKQQGRLVGADLDHLRRMFRSSYEFLSSAAAQRE